MEHPRAMARSGTARVAALATLAGCACALAWTAHLRRADASCAAPRFVVSHRVRVVACEAIDVGAQSRVQAMARTMPPAVAASLLAGYRGALVDVDVLSTQQRWLDVAPPRGTVHAAALAGGASRGRATYFAAGNQRAPCSGFAVGAQLSLDDEAPCCDGDPGAPCIYVMTGIERRRAP